MQKRKPLVLQREVVLYEKATQGGRLSANWQASKFSCISFTI
jgi:hypothetical protein